MEYLKVCLFDWRMSCPLSGHDLEVDGSLCGSCVEMKAVERMRVQTIAQLLITYQSEEKAREVWNKIGRLAREW